MISLNSYKNPETTYLLFQGYGALKEASVTLATVNWYAVTKRSSA